MSEASRVVVPTAFLSVKIELEESVMIEQLSVIPSRIMINKEKNVPLQSVNVSVNREQIIVVEPGVYFVSAILGNVESDQYRIEINPGQIKGLIFHFGREA